MVYLLKFKSKHEKKNSAAVTAINEPQPSVKNSLSSPFQAIVTKEDSEFINRDLMREISMETLKSPIIKSSPTVQQEPKNTQSEHICEEDEIEFTPQYILEDDISSISELKEIIAKKRPPKISFVLNNDLSCISQSERKSLDKINSLDTRKIISKIEKKIEDIDFHLKRQGISHRYKIAMLPTQKKEIPEKKYLCADEIITLRRKEAEEKKAKTAVFLAQKSDVKSMEDLAKLYYESDIKEYDTD